MVNLNLNGTAVLVTELTDGVSRIHIPSWDQANPKQEFICYQDSQAEVTRAPFVGKDGLRVYFRSGGIGGFPGDQLAHQNKLKGGEGRAELYPFAAAADLLDAVVGFDEVGYSLARRYASMALNGTIASAQGLGTMVQQHLAQLKEELQRAPQLAQACEHGLLRTLTCGGIQIYVPTIKGMELLYKRPFLQALDTMVEHHGVD